MLAAGLWARVLFLSCTDQVRESSHCRVVTSRCACLYINTHTQTQAPRGETDSTEVVGLAPKAWSEIKYQECAGQYSLSFLIQTGGRSEEMRSLGGSEKKYRDANVKKSYCCPVGAVCGKACLWSWGISLHVCVQFPCLMCLHIRAQIDTCCWFLHT